MQTQGGTWKYVGTVPAIADASVPQSAVLQREFKAFVWSNPYTHTNLRWFYFLFTVGGFSGCEYPPPSPLPNFQGPLTF